MPQIQGESPHFQFCGHLHKTDYFQFYIHLLQTICFVKLFTHNQPNLQFQTIIVREYLTHPIYPTITNSLNKHMTPELIIFKDILHQNYCSSFKDREMEDLFSHYGCKKLCILVCTVLENTQLHANLDAC